MRIRTLPICTLAFAAALGTAMTAHAGEGTILGTGIGAAVGGFLGSQIGQGSGQVLSTTLGIAVGGTIGHNIGREVDQDSYHRRARQNRAVMSDPPPVSYPYSYTPNYVAPSAPPPIYIDRMPPPNPEEQSAETFCRPYSQEIRIDGEVHESFGTACLQPDGTWHIVQ